MYIQASLKMMEHSLSFFILFFQVSLLFFLCRNLGSKGSWHKKNYKETWENRIKNNKQCSIVFNKTCLNNNLVPKYTLFKIYIYI